MAFAQNGEINGRVLDATTGEAVIGAYVFLEVDSTNIIYRGVTDYDGYYVIKPVASGTYDIRVSSVTFSQQLLRDISVSEGQIRKLDFNLSVNELKGVIIESYVGMVETGYTGTISIITHKEIENSATSTPINFISVITPGSFQEDEDSPIQFRGAREDATLYIVDGVKIMGEPVIIRNSVQDMLVYTGGIPARYGDATGGIIVITTKSYNKIR